MGAGTGVNIAGAGGVAAVQKLLTAPPCSQGLAYAMVAVEFVFGFEDGSTFAALTALHAANGMGLRFSDVETRMRDHACGWRYLEKARRMCTDWLPSKGIADSAAPTKGVQVAGMPSSSRAPLHIERWSWRSMRFKVYKQC